MVTTELRGIKSLTEKQRLVVEGLAAHKKSKQIARELDVPYSTVEERIRSACRKVGVADRSQLVQIYMTAIRADRNSVQRIHGLAESSPSAEELVRDLPEDPDFTLHDAATFAQWNEMSDRPTFLETLDERFGIAGRVMFIVLAFLILTLGIEAVFDALESANSFM